mmetsp:Transcript_13801/g.30009  ORF Transcript_13801/g.30009 Transcript_13801/m.30009 type:complete len:220 (+) Transcript_13801:1867-2526(+)
MVSFAMVKSCALMGCVQEGRDLVPIRSQYASKTNKNALNVSRIKTVALDFTATQRRTRANPAQRMSIVRITSIATGMKLVPKAEFAFKDRHHAQDRPPSALNSREAVSNVRKTSIVITKYSATARKNVWHMPALLEILVLPAHHIAMKMKRRAPKAYVIMPSIAATPKLVSEYVEISKTKIAKTSSCFVAVPLRFTAAILYLRTDSATVIRAGISLGLI